MASLLLSPALILLVVSVLVGVVVGVLIWRRRPDPGAVPLAAMMASLVVWAGVYAVGMVTHDPAARRTIEQLLWFGIVSAPVAWFAFALEYTGHGYWLSRRTLAALLVVPVVSLALVFTNAHHHLVWASHEVLIVDGLAIARQTYGPWFWVFAVYSYGLILGGSLLLLGLVVTSKTMYADQAIALVVGTLAPTAANLASVLGFSPLPGLDMTPYAIAISGVTCGYALNRYRLFDLVPATRRLGRDAVVDNMRDAVVIVDEGDRIADCNPPALAAFDAEESAVLGEPLSVLLGEATVPDPDETREVTGARGRRTYELRAAPIENWQGRRVGKVLVLRDVTERVQRQQRLSVLNRVLRHNLRNDMNVVAARADAIRDESDGEPAEHAATIGETAADLVDLSEKIRAFDRVVEGAGEDAPVDVVAVVESAAAALRAEYPDVTVDVTVSAERPVESSDAELVGLALDNLMENAAEHNDAADPWVEVRVADGRGSIVVTVTDNGPPIPDNERAVLEGTPESQLVHGTGIGLWTANWCVRRLGGTLDVGQTGDRGNVLTVTLPATPAAEGPVEQSADESNA